MFKIKEYMPSPTIYEMKHWTRPYQHTLFGNVFCRESHYRYRLHPSKPPQRIISTLPGPSCYAPPIIEIEKRPILSASFRTLPAHRLCLLQCQHASSHAILRPEHGYTPDYQLSFCCQLEF